MFLDIILILSYFLPSFFIHLCGLYFIFLYINKLNIDFICLLYDVISFPTKKKTFIYFECVLVRSSAKFAVDIILMFKLHVMLILHLIQHKKP